MCNGSFERLLQEVEQVTCWDCGQEFKATGLVIDGKPACKRCSIHHVTHAKFDARCPLCQLERRVAQKESLRLEAWQQSRKEKESKDASNSGR